MNVKIISCFKFSYDFQCNNTFCEFLSGQNSLLNLVPLQILIYYTANIVIVLIHVLKTCSEHSLELNPCFETSANMQFYICICFRNHHPCLRAFVHYNIEDFGSKIPSIFHSEILHIGQEQEFRNFETTKGNKRSNMNHLEHVF